MSLWQYKDATRAELWEILQTQLEETQRLTADLDDLQTFFDSCYEELQATRSAHDKIKQERDELLNNQTKRDLEMQALILNKLASEAYTDTKDGWAYKMLLQSTANQLTKQAQEL